VTIARSTILAWLRSGAVVVSGVFRAASTGNGAEVTTESAVDRSQCSPGFESHQTTETDHPSRYRSIISVQPGCFGSPAVDHDELAVVRHTVGEEVFPDLALIALNWLHHSAFVPLRVPVDIFQLTNDDDANAAE
jgi:hypothetical protein